MNLVLKKNISSHKDKDVDMDWLSYCGLNDFDVNTINNAAIVKKFFFMCMFF